MVFDLDEYMKQDELQVKKSNNEFDLDVFLQQTGSNNVVETPTIPIQTQKATFAEEHPIINSAINGIKQIPENTYNAISNIGNVTQNVQPQYQYNNDTPLLTGGISKKSFMNDQRYWLKTKANNFGDALLRIA